ncbi:MAG: FAD-dependent oxidoreductase [Rhodobacteraceae bacterium]|nr:FAD-dependent oxidoreductase [Paracoccaceae bacterium]
MKTRVAIVGGGLAGLFLADCLHEAGIDFQVFEARPRPGGRIAALETPVGRVDLGPSWFWPGQPLVAALAADLGLRAFAQYSTGDLCFEDQSGRVQRGVGFASMEGAWRLEGGMVGLIEGLAARLPQDRMTLDCPVRRITRDGEVFADEGRLCQAEHIVLALPPRIAARLVFEPTLAPDVMQALEAIPTWMAGHAKFVAVYDRPFWREGGLSGDAMSRRGPLAEIHDASGPDGRPAALFGFLGVAASHRVAQADELERSALEQLARLFGAGAMSPVQTGFMDWAFEPETATQWDQDEQRGHPAYGLPPELMQVWDGRLHFSSTETASGMGGLMEGALSSAQRVFSDILAVQHRDPA